MNEASAWRLELGRRLGRGYAANPKARVVQVAGSTARGTADRYSDLEIDVYWSEPPTDAERLVAIEAGGGTAEEIAPYEEDEWSETILFGGFHIGTSTFLVETMERYLHDVVDECRTDPLAQIRISSLLGAQTVAGEDLVAQWRTRAAAYPPGLTEAMLRENLEFAGFGYDEEMLAARDDLLRLYDRFCGVERQILGALLGLNRIYLPNPGFKSMTEIIGGMPLAPPDLAARLKRAFHLPPLAGVAALHGVIADVLGLLETTLPDFDTAPYRANMAQRRGVWEQAPRPDGG